jgi:hypothetical protein
MQWTHVDLLVAERQRELLACSARGRLAEQAQERHASPIGWRGFVWSFGHAMETLGQRLEVAANPADPTSEPEVPRGAFV